MVELLGNVERPYVQDVEAMIIGLTLSQNVTQNAYVVSKEYCEGRDWSHGGHGGSDYASEENKCYSTPRADSREYCEDRDGSHGGHGGSDYAS